MAKKEKGCLTAILAGSLIKGLFLFLKALLVILFKILAFTGLYFPIIYIGIGLVLNWYNGFNPLSWDMVGQLYFGGALGMVLMSVIITVKNAIIIPTKYIIEGFQKPLWERKKEENRSTEEVASSAAEEVVQKHRSWDKKRKDDLSYTQPLIYYSTIEKDTLIYEYPDRFEVFKLRYGQYMLDKVEFKYEEKRN